MPIILGAVIIVFVFACDVKQAIIPTQPKDLPKAVPTPVYFDDRIPTPGPIPEVK